MRLSELQAMADRAGWNLLYTHDWELIRARQKWNHMVAIGYENIDTLGPGL